MNDVLAIIDANPTLGSLRRECERLLSSDPAHDLRHCLRVADWTIRLAPELDLRLAVAAALLHDIVNVPKDSEERALASERSAQLARELLARVDFSSGEIDLVCDAIEDHSFSRGQQPRSLLGMALQDADRLEALGAIGVFRCVSTGVKMGASYFDAEDPWGERRALDDRRFSVDHFFTKLLRLPPGMHTETGRIEAERRAAFLREFLAELGRELDLRVSSPA